MQKTVMTKAVAVALATLGAGAAFAQSTFTIYGNADVSLDNVHKTAGTSLLTGSTPVPALGGATLAQATQGKKSTLSRVSPSATSQTSFGFKGTEDIGGGLKASFVLEGQLSHDTGALSQDGRIFGRQSYVGLTTPYGEVRLGRQYAPIFYSTALVTGERFGATDLFIEGGATNNLQVRQDNQISYWLAYGPLTGAVAYSPNAGATSNISSARGASATSANGSILGAAGAGTESVNTKAGRAFGYFANYQFDPALNATFGFHRNEFDGAKLTAYDPAAGVLGSSSLALDKYQSYNLGVKYVMPQSNIMLDAAFGQGKYSYGGTDDNLKLRFMVVGMRVPVDAWTFSAQASQIKFTNFTKGKDTGLMLGSEYTLSKRTALFARFVQIRDDAGDAANGGFSAALGNVQGGPDVVATSFGFRETPLFAGAGINPGGKATYFGAGIRHSF
jgi:predicted porin